MTTMGHNSEVDGSHLRAFVERVERIETEIRDLNDDKSEIYKEAKGCGFDAKIMKKIIARRRMDRQKRIEEDEIMSLYLEALGEE
jgi:uncharacterized protein (UPF0335 family)